MNNFIEIYVQTDKNTKVITNIKSSIESIDFLNEIWNKIDEGYELKHIHPKNNYLEKGLMDEKGRFNYKYDNVLVELTDEEKNVLFPPIPLQPTEVEVLKEKNATLEKALLEMADVQSKEYENRVMLENAVLDLANTIAGGL